MEFKAEVIDGKVKVHPIIERKENGDITVHVPSLSTIAKFTKEHGKRNIQPV